MAAYDDAVAELYQAPHGDFVTERKRLAAELKAAGDKQGAARLAKLARPTISAWAVNQLWWHARDAFDELFEAASRLRAGSLDATGPHREAIAKLRARAARMLADANHGASEATLRKITQTLAALAAAGTWEPASPGALAADRDPPGFEALGIAPPPPSTPVESPRTTTTTAPVAPTRDEVAEARRKRAETEERERQELEAERQRVEILRAKLRTERHRLETLLRAARDEAEAREREAAALEQQLTAVRESVAEARAVVEALEAKLEELGN